MHVRTVRFSAHSTSLRSTRISQPCPSSIRTPLFLLIHYFPPPRQPPQRVVLYYSFSTLYWFTLRYQIRFVNDERYLSRLGSVGMLYAM
jgi:hypothetical protein